MEPGRVDGLGDEADGGRGGSRQVFACQREGHRPRRTKAAGQVPCRAAIGHQPEVGREGEDEEGSFGGHDHVAGEREARAHTRRRAVYRRDHRLVEVAQAFHQGVGRLVHLAGHGLAQGLVALGFQPAKLGARAEAPALPREHHRMDRVIRRDPVERVEQFALHRHG